MNRASSVSAQGLGTQSIVAVTAFEYPQALAVGGFFCANGRFAAIH